MPGPTLPKPDALPSPLLKKPEDGVVVEFPKPGALVMLIGMLIGPKPPLAVKFRGDPGMVKPGIVTGLVPPLNGTFNPNGLIAKPGIVTALVQLVIAFAVDAELEHLRAGPLRPKLYAQFVFELVVTAPHGQPFL